MYARWQQRIFDHGSFDVFLETLEKIGSTHQLKVPCAWPLSCCSWQLHSQRLCPTAVARVLQALACWRCPAAAGSSQVTLVEQLHSCLRCKCSAAAVGHSQNKLH